MSRTRNVANTSVEKPMGKQTEEKTIIPSQYGCDVLLEKTSFEKAKDPSFPNDAYLIWYEVDGIKHLDLTRGTRVRIFDMYYDKYGPGSVQKIDWGYGRVNPKLWGYKQPDNKKKK